MRVEDLDTPAVIVDLDIMQGNLKSLAHYSRQYELSLRPHTKTHKTPQISKMQIEFGCHGITVAKVGEAEVMARSGMDDILIAYPVLGKSKLDRLTKLAKLVKVSVSLDSFEVANAISEAARQAGCNIEILVEFDVGMHRCGLQSISEWLRVAREVDQLQNLKFKGLMFYAGHIWDPPDQQTAALNQLSATIEEIRHESEKAGLAMETVSGEVLRRPTTVIWFRGLTEIRAGTYVFYDMNEFNAGYCQLSQCALKVLVTVVSHAVEGHAMIDGGSKTFSGDHLKSGDRSGFGRVTRYPDIQFVSMSEEHGHLDVSRSNDTPKIGDKLTVIPNHVCTCVNMHDQIYYHRNGIVEEVWAVEGRGKIR